MHQLMHGWFQRQHLERLDRRLRRLALLLVAGFCFWTGGGYQAIMRDHDQEPDIVYHGASEMRKDGMAAGY